MISMTGISSKCNEDLTHSIPIYTLQLRRGIGREYIGGDDESLREGTEDGDGEKGGVKFLCKYQSCRSTCGQLSPAIAGLVSALRVVIHMCSAAATVDLTYMWIIYYGYKVYNAQGAKN